MTKMMNTQVLPLQNSQSNSGSQPEGIIYQANSDIFHFHNMKGVGG